MQLWLGCAKHWATRQTVPGCRETLARRGYRFMPAVEKVKDGQDRKVLPLPAPGLVRVPVN